MQLNVAKVVAALQRMTTAALRAKYAEVFGEATKTGNRVWLIRRISWRLQALAEGDLSDRARQRAAELANDADIRLSPPKPKPATTALEHPKTAVLPFPADGRLPPPGSILTREYKGQRLQVKILSQGFEFEGEIYRSLSAVAKAITGSHCNGFLFFRMSGKGGRA
jgi:hypothetical protein